VLNQQIVKTIFKTKIDLKPLFEILNI